MHGLLIEMANKLVDINEDAGEAVSALTTKKAGKPNFN